MKNSLPVSVILFLVFGALSQAFGAAHNSRWESDIPDAPFRGKAIFPEKKLNEYLIPSVGPTQHWLYNGGAVACRAKLPDASEFDFTIENLRPFAFGRNADWSSFYQTYDYKGSFTNFYHGGVFNEYPAVSRFYLQSPQPKSTLSVEQQYLTSPLAAAFWLDRGGQKLLVFEHPVLDRKPNMTLFDSAKDNLRFVTVEKVSDTRYIFQAYYTSEDLYVDRPSAAYRYDATCDQDVQNFIITELRRRLLTKLPTTLKVYTPQEFKDKYSFQWLSHFYTSEGSTYYNNPKFAPNITFLVDADGDYFIRVYNNIPMNHKLAQDYARLRPAYHKTPQIRSYPQFSYTVKSGAKNDVIKMIQDNGLLVFTEPPPLSKTFDLTFSADNITMVYGPGLPQMTVKSPKISFKETTYPYSFCYFVGAHTDQNFFTVGLPESYLVRYAPYSGPVLRLSEVSHLILNRLRLYTSNQPFHILPQGTLENGAAIAEETCFVHNMALFHSAYRGYPVSQPNK